MTTIVIGLYDNADKANQVVNDLAKAGFNKNNTQMLSGQGSEAIVGKLTSQGISQDEAGLYGEAIRRGHAVICLEAPDEKAEQALDILNRHGARDIEELRSQLRQGAQQQGQGRQEQRQTVPVVEEQVSVGKRRVLRGGARITTTVTERPVEETVRLREEHVDVERQKVDRPISPQEADKAFQEKTVEATETAEEAVVSKQARVVEEVALRKTAQEHEEKVHETARRTDVKVEEIEPKAKPEGQR